MISIKKVPADKLDDECIMCYGALKYLHETPTSPVFPSIANDGVIANTAGFSDQTPQQLGSDIEAGSKNEPFVKKAKTCAVTPCKHYFHESCFNQWIEVRQQCPICRHPLKFYS